MANTKIQIKRTNVAGRKPNTSDPSNTSYIAAGEFALNMADKILYTSNGSDVIAVGASQANIVANTITVNNISTDGGISIGNSTVNASINSTALFAGNAASNVVVNTTILTVSNSVTNSTITSGSIFTGNSSANAQFNIGIGTVSLTINNYSYDSSTGVVTFNTTTNHGITGQTKGQYVTISGLSTAPASLFNGVNEIYSAPTANTITILKPIGGAVTSASRTSGVATIATAKPHGFIAGDTFTVTGINPDISYPDMTFNGTYTVKTAPTTTTLTYDNQPSITVSPTGFYVDKSVNSQPVFVTATAHGLSNGMPVSTTTTFSRYVNSAFTSFFLNTDTWIGPSLSTTAPTIFLELDSNYDLLTDGLTLTVKTPTNQYITFTSASTSACTFNTISAVFTEAPPTALTASNRYIVQTPTPHGLGVGTYVQITGLPTTGTTGAPIATALNSGTTPTLRQIVDVNTANSFVVIGSTAQKGLSITSSLSTANLYLRAPTNLAVNTTNKITRLSNKLIRIDGVTTSTSTTPGTNWIASGFPRSKFKLKSARFYKLYGQNTIRIQHNFGNIFNLDDRLAIVCTSYPAKDVIKNIFETGYQLWYGPTTSVGTTGNSSYPHYFDIALDPSADISGITDGTYYFLEENSDYIIRPFKTGGSSTSNTSWLFSRTYTAANVTTVDSTSFRLGISNAPGDEKFAANLASSASPIPLTAGTVKYNTDKASTAVIISPGAFAGISSISPTTVSASASTFISPFAEVSNSSATVKVTASTFYNGNSTSNVFVNSTSFEVASSAGKQVTNSSSISLTKLSGGLPDPTQPTLTMNNSVIQVSMGTKYWRAGYIGGRMISETGGSELSVGTESDNTFIQDSSIRLSDGTTTNYIAANGVQLYSNLDISGPLTIANSYGTNGQILYTDGAYPYWGDTPSFNPDLNYVFNGTVSFNNEVFSTSVYTAKDSDLNYTYLTPVGVEAIANNNEMASFYGNGTIYYANSQDANTNTLFVNSSVLIVGNSSVNATINSTAFTGNANTASTANNATYAFGKIEGDLNVNSSINSNTANNSTYAFGKTEGNLNVNSATAASTANNASYLGGTAAARFVQNTDSRTLSGNLTFTGLSTFTGNIVINAVSSNGSYGSAGQVLTSNGTATYWSTPASVSGVNTDAQFTWTNTHTFTNTVTFGNSTVNSSANSTALYVANSTGNVTVGPYGITVAANGLGFYKLGNSSVNTTANASGFYTTGLVNASAIQVGSSFSANTTRVVIDTSVGLQANGSLGASNQVLTSNGTTVYWSTVAAGGFSNGQSISVNNFTVTGAVTANSSNGSAGQILTSNGSGVYWSSAAGAQGGGTDRIFYENDTTITSNYTITSGKNAMTAGPITINSGVTVTIPNNSVWTIV